jgi:tetratricopeptide (TPR) repeat protein
VLRTFTYRIILLTLLAQVSFMPLMAQKKGELTEDQQVRLTTVFLNAEKAHVLGNVEEATRLFQECLTIDPDNDAAYFNIGKIFLELEMMPDAEINFEKAVKLDETNKWYWLSWAQALIAQEKYEEAAKIYAKMTKRYSSDVQLEMDYASTLLQAGDSKKALKEFDKIELKTGPSHDIARRKYQYYINAGKYDDAANEIEKLLDVYPGDNQLYGMLAELYKAQGKIDKAILVYEKAYKAEPTNPYIQLSLAEFYDRAGRRDTSYVYLKKAYNNPNLYIDTKVSVLLKMFKEAEQYPKVRIQAIELCSLVINTHPEEAKSYSVYGDCLNLDGQRSQAIDQYRKAVKIDPSRFAIWNQILFLDSELSDYEGLIEDSEKALEYFPAQPSVYLFNGIAHNQQKQHKQAAASLKRGAELVIGNNFLSAQMLASLGDAYHELGMATSSDSAYEASLSYDPNNAYVLNNYSYFLSLREEQLDIAKEMSARSLELEPANPSYLDTYGWILFKLKDYTQAAEKLKSALENGGKNSAEVHEHFGDALFKLGKIDNALDHWKQAQELGSENPQLQEKINTKTLVD